MTLLDAAQEILKQAGAPLHYADIASRAVGPVCSIRGAGCLPPLFTERLVSHALHLQVEYRFGEVVHGNITSSNHLPTGTTYYDYHIIP
jgi:hypothetical protein